MGTMSGVVQHLKKELGRALQEVQRFTAALAALGSAHPNGRRTLSAAARKKISLAQKARWAKAKGRRNPGAQYRQQAERESQRPREHGGSG